MTSVSGGQGELRWSPQLKGVVRRAGGDLSGSAQAASMAMGQIKAIELRKQSGQGFDEAYLQKISQTLNSRASKRFQASASSESFASSKGWWIAAGIAAATGCLAFGACWVSRGPAHSVSGTLLLMRTPIVGADVVFHPTKSGGKPTRTTTGEDGSFRIAGLLPDAYKITIDPGESNGSMFPVSYSSASTTPLMLNVFRDRDMKQVRVNTMTQPPRKKT
ncbi:MAG: carboxypeptidase-like regulatory domain-containing protein [Pirellulales bacterium]